MLCSEPGHFSSNMPSAPTAPQLQAYCCCYKSDLVFLVISLQSAHQNSDWQGFSSKIRGQDLKYVIEVQ